MTTYSPEAHARRTHVTGWLVAVIALAAGLVALGAWTLVDRYAGSDTEAAQIIDDMSAAVNAGDAETLRALFARDAVFVMPSGQQVSGLDNVVRAVLIPHSVRLQIERAGPIASAGDFSAAFTRYDGGMELGVWQFNKNGKIAQMWVYAP